MPPPPHQRPPLMGPRPPPLDLAILQARMWYLGLRQQPEWQNSYTPTYNYLNALSPNFVCQYPTPPKLKKTRRKKTKKSDKKQIQEEEEKKEEVETNFLVAFPTKTIPDETIQSLLPEDWSKNCVSDFNSNGVIRRPVVDLPEIFDRICQGLVVHAVEKVENPYLWLMYQLKFVENSELFRSTETDLFHGTSGKNVYPIIRDNFDYRLAGSCVGHRSGKGVYFAHSPRFCMHFSQVGKCMVMAKVLTGRTCVGTQETQVPENSCDSAENGRGTIVKFGDHEFYPQFLIHFLDHFIFPQ
ncbi:protein mono-ADP-ribosyltransferase PARP12-like isoform X2 [Neocloeon triangulifer]|uniref:protein mono-ADP-ribosyltransferase PARP12-like isoform X2 n=1 Tax=Neocloeon triangulifer TaxID=2078957 RepID=UPI00286F3578|nr:protein mono-ADP-ribosyltransferase PARP12-like isoform X2 [Neocloeon triangulifer]